MKEHSECILTKKKNDSDKTFGRENVIPLEFSIFTLHGNLKLPAKILLRNNFGNF